MYMLYCFQLVEQCEKSCMLAAGCEQMVTAAEESLVQLLPPEGPIDHAWIHKAEMLISGWSFCLHSENRGDT